MTKNCENLLFRLLIKIIKSHFRERFEQWKPENRPKQVRE